MNPSLLTATSSYSSSSQRIPLLSFPFTPNSLPTRRRYRVSFPRNSLSNHEQPPASTSSSSSETTTIRTSSDIFGGPKELTGIQPVVEKLSPPVRLATSAVILAGALAAGYSLGLRFGGNRNAALGGAAVLGSAGGAAAYALNAAVPEVAAVSLHNYVAGCDGPDAIRREDIENIAQK